MSTSWALCDASKLVVVRFFGSRVRVHRDLVLPLQAVASVALYTDYGKWLFQNANSQGYNCRSARGARFHSEHGHGIALDIRPPQNPYRATDGSPKPVLVTDFARFGVADGVAWINSWKVNGFVWGGDWTRDLALTPRVLGFIGRPNPFVRKICDAMHMQMSYSPAEVRARRREFEWRRDTAGGRRPERRSA